ncbi:MAG TPA: type II toxin-antitoxin system RelE/ParE family toxin [Candidatus Peribacteraceae bacterium]|nr:type II toxin-antitoxin system RelE/ParE family toxin [Candidatus Peribacteraceae bacterium]
MTYRIEYTEHIDQSRLKKLPQKTLLVLKKTIERKLSTAPETFGKPLRRSLRGYRSLRIGDYRVIFRIEGKTVKIFLIAHRSIVYQTKITE